MDMTFTFTTARLVIIIISEVILVGTVFLLGRDYQKEKDKEFQDKIKTGRWK